MKLTSVFFALAIILSSCNKDDTAIPIASDKPYMNAKFNGEWVKTIYPAIIVSEIENPDPDGEPSFIMSITGGELGSNYNLLTLVIATEGEPMERKYGSDGECLSVDGCFGISYQVVVNGNEEAVYNSGYGETAQATINFTILEFESGGRVKGTFSGVIFEKDMGEKIEVTDGEFDTFMD